MLSKNRDKFLGYNGFVSPLWWTLSLKPSVTEYSTTAPSAWSVSLDLSIQEWHWVRFLIYLTSHNISDQHWTKGSSCLLSQCIILYDLHDREPNQHYFKAVYMPTSRYVQVNHSNADYKLITTCNIWFTILHIGVWTGPAGPVLADRFLR